MIPYTDISVHRMDSAYVWCRTCMTAGPKCSSLDEAKTLWNEMERPVLVGTPITIEGRRIETLLAENKSLKAANVQLRKHYSKFEQAELNRVAKERMV